jgi:hypothetical protein
MVVFLSIGNFLSVDNPRENTQMARLQLNDECIKDLKIRHNPESADFAEKLFNELYPQKTDFLTFSDTSSLYAPLLKELLQEEKSQIAFLQQLENYVKSDHNYAAYCMLECWYHRGFVKENVVLIWLNKYALPRSRCWISEFLDWLDDHRDDPEEDLES